MRVHNWDVQLAIWASAQLGQAFAWGTTDCASLLRQSQAIIYGRDLWPEIAYDSKVSALRVLTEVGSIHQQLIAKGAVDIRLPFAQSGDILLTESADPIRSRCLVVIADKVLVAEEDAPITTMPLLSAPGRVYRL